jgi:adenine deaminase
MRETLERRIDQAMGRMAADLVLRNARILDLATGAFHSGDIAICGEMIVGTGDSYRGLREIDAGGRTAVPGFIDSHVHCESTLVVPGEFDRCVLTRGTTTAICDPHEICNVLGVAGLRYFSIVRSALRWICACSSPPACRRHRSKLLAPGSAQPT